MVEPHGSSAGSPGDAATTPGSGARAVRGWAVVLGLAVAVALVARAFAASLTAGSLLVGVAALFAVLLVAGRAGAGKDERGRTDGIRVAVEARATVTPAGGCAWCGHPGAHRADSGHVVHPAVWHALEVEEAIRRAVDGPDGVVAY
ncbi:hypothetical protein [Pseudonocardia phyllosphaerae]|uniref:hypothetical protein n=1 Tax=Pseudonocardia phyllosphaerae TaxID=3390502 RepID=UPI00397B695D